ncbi:SubName: Full=Uncharacterized protein {ECO:0000313/EMBL:CCA76568.1} [Serendipita indica DSM 11827]|nr:SubName: Full=Uncharacterized protein {ECO:0000313/EMBL:CCA76568.1} [Serendipita indica DSM 11827]
MIFAEQTPSTQQPSQSHVTHYYIPSQHPALKIYHSSPMLGRSPAFLSAPTPTHSGTLQTMACTSGESSISKSVKAEQIEVSLNTLIQAPLAAEHDNRTNASSDGTPEEEIVLIKSEETKPAVESRRGVAKKVMHPLAKHHVSALERYCQGHSISPSLLSRKKWADINHVIPARVHALCKKKTTQNAKKKENVSAAEWDLPLEVAPEETIIKTEVILESILDEGHATRSEDSPTVEPSSSTCNRPSSRQNSVRFSTPPLAEATPADTTIGSSSTLVTPQSSMIQLPTSIKENKKTPVESVNRRWSPSPCAINDPFERWEMEEPPLAPSDAELLSFLNENNFFNLVQGPHGITFEDMVDREAFDRKLVYHQCRLDRYFVWSTLRKFYFFC